jgi:hypothetical protein
MSADARIGTTLSRNISVFSGFLNDTAISPSATF